MEIIYIIIIQTIKPIISSYDELKREKYYIKIYIYFL